MSNNVLNCDTEPDTMKREHAQIQATFHLPDDREAIGQLLVNGPNSRLKLTSRSTLPDLRKIQHLCGTTLDLQKVTCIDCLPLSQNSPFNVNRGTYYCAEVFPHFVAVGNEHIDPDFASVYSISFTVDDLSSLFHDFVAFGRVTDAMPLMDSVLSEIRQNWPVEAGEYPEIVYFTGKQKIIEIETDIGKFSIIHRPSTSIGSPDGIYFKNRMLVSLELDSPITFRESIKRIIVIAQFLSMIAGCEQCAHNIQLQTAAPEGKAWPPLSIYWSYAYGIHWSNDSYSSPNSNDVPLDPIRRPEEFSNVLKNWVSRQETWQTSRFRYINCLSKGGYYDVDRLVAAANMFDLLPEEAVPLPEKLPGDLAQALKECKGIMKALPVSPDRNRALSDLGRIGKPSLTKKALHRTNMVMESCGCEFKDLNCVIHKAVQCRNYFVHGSPFDFNAFSKFVPFFTDALEFVFAASDLIEAGWDIKRWGGEPHSNGHPFARFKATYNNTFAQFKPLISR
jgi:hypothetical protein